MSIDSVASPDERFDSDRWPLKLALIAALTTLADWLFFRHEIGISLVVFVIALGAAVLIATPTWPNRREMLAATAVLIAALVPLVEATNPFSVAFSIIGAAYFALVASVRASGPLRERASAVASLLFTGPLWVFPDIGRAIHAAQRTGAVSAMSQSVKAWVMPVALGALFLLLFASANPVLESWLTQLSFGDSLFQVDGWRIAFWLIVIAAMWPFISMSRRWIADVSGILPESEDAAPELPEAFFGFAAVTRALILFNLLFAVQTAMDIHYLWRGAALPHSMTYAAYAHRGAYPLVITALLAALFVIVTMRPGTAAERSPVMRALVVLWTGQNVLLVVSSILRLDLYVEAYSLTYLRVAAFVWMGLVAVGLILILARIILYRSNTWLIGGNLAALAVAAYVSSLVNFPYLIASYNVAHSREASGQGVGLDLSYLIDLGPQALPALDEYIARGAHPAARQPLTARRDNLAALYLGTMRDWRGWNFRAWRLKRYLEGRAPGATANTSTSP
jgi:uncharacterized protein DUF4153